MNHNRGEAGVVRVSEEDARVMAADPGDHLYVSDPGWWFGGLKSVHAVLTQTGSGETGAAGIIGQKKFAFDLWGDTWSTTTVGDPTPGKDGMFETALSINLNRADELLWSV